MYKDLYNFVVFKVCVHEGEGSVKPNTGKRSLQYPYSKNRVYVSVVIFLLSLVLVVTLLEGDLFLMLYYFISTFILTAATFLLKVRLYPLLTEEPTQTQPSKNEGEKTMWKTFLLALSMLIVAFLIPLLLAGFLSPVVWFILLISFTSGVSISEIIFYLKT